MNLIPLRTAAETYGRIWVVYNAVSNKTTQLAEGNQVRYRFMDMNFVGLAAGRSNNTVIWHRSFPTKNVQHEGDSLVTEHVISIED